MRKYAACLLFLAAVTTVSVAVCDVPEPPPAEMCGHEVAPAPREKAPGGPNLIRIVKYPIPLFSGVSLINYEPVAEPPVWTLPPGEAVPMTLTAEACPKADEARDWGHTNLKLAEAHKVTRGKGVRVAVLDTGADLNHRDLKGRLVGAKDQTNSRSGPSDVQGHGSHCAGIAVGSENGTGIVGAAPEASLLVGKVLGDTGNGSVDGIARGIDWAVAEGADVVSMSLGGPGADSWIPPALDRAEAAGVIVVAAAGNEGPGANTCGYPGLYAKCLAVAATDRANATAPFSSRCAAVYVAAPGVGVLSAYPGDRFATLSGTSMATPYVAGLAALWIASHPEVAKKDRPAKFREALKAACADLAPAGRDTATGWGLPDAAKLVAGGGTVPEPKPPENPGVEVIRFAPTDLRTAEGYHRLLRLALDPSTKMVEVTVPKP